MTEVAEEYGIRVLLVDEAYTSQTCPLCGKPHKRARIARGLFRCPAERIVFNADLVGAYNILKKIAGTITPSLPNITGGRGNRLEAQPGAEPDVGVAPNPPALAGAPAS